MALLEQIKKGLNGKARFVAPESEGVDIILALQGCETACADLSGFRGIEIRTVTGIEGGEKFLREVRNAIDGCGSDL